MATQWGRKAVVAYLKRVADPNMLEVCNIEDSCGEAPTLTDTSQLPFVLHVRTPRMSLH